MHVEINKESFTFILSSHYHWGRDTDRLTRYLHQLMYRLKEQGKAHEFAIEGTPWRTTFEELKSFNQTKKKSRLTELNRLYV